MQQTEKYELNLIETSDTFSPNALNENMEKVEAALDAARAEAAAGNAAEAEARAAGDAALDQRVTVLEGHKMILGGYDGGSVMEVSLGVTPKAVILRSDNGTVFIAFKDSPLSYGGTGPRLFITEGGFQAYGTCSSGGRSYYYIAIV